MIGSIWKIPAGFKRHHFYRAADREVITVSSGSIVTILGKIDDGERCLIHVEGEIATEVTSFLVCAWKCLSKDE